MLFWRHVLAVALVVLCSPAYGDLAMIQMYLKGSSCATPGPSLYIKEDVCYSTSPGTSFMAVGAGNNIKLWGTSQTCSGAETLAAPYSDTTTCQSVSFFPDFKYIFQLNSVPVTGGKIRKREELDVPVDGSCAKKSDEVDLTYEMDADTCLPSGLDLALFKYVKYTTASISGEETWLTESYHSDAACTTTPTFSSTPTLLNSCTHTDVGPDFACSSAPCSHAPHSTVQTKNIHYNEGTLAGNTVNYAKLRFYQDNTCRLPTTYMDPALEGVSGIASYNGANVGQTGNMNTDGTYFRTGEQTYDGNAPGQVTYVPVNTESNLAVCTQVETGPASSPINGIKCKTGTDTQCELFLDTACTTSASSILNDTTSCNAMLYAKVESFAAGIHLSSTSVVAMTFATAGAGVLGLATNPRKAQECGGIPSITVSQLDTCHVNAAISTGHTWDTVQQEYRCSDSWDTQLEQATIEATATDCMARCTAMDCRAISYGKDFPGQNHKCVLCKDVTLAGDSKWDTYMKIATPPFVKITTGTGSIDTFKTTYHTDSDCSGVGLTPYTDINRLSTCRSVSVRAGHTRAAQDAYLGAITLTATMTPVQKLAAVRGAGLYAGGDSYASDEVGCPDVQNYVYTEGEYTFEQSNGVNNKRVCSVQFIGPPGTMLSIDFISFSFATGSCYGTPAQCMCTGETVTIRDGLRLEKGAIGQPLCGSWSPGRYLLSGNTGRMDIVATDASSTFRVYVTHQVNKVNMVIPPNPSFALGSHITIDWYLDASAGHWAECGTGDPQMSQMHGVGKKTPNDERWARAFPCARSPASDHGWIGIYRNGTCEDGPMVPHTVTDPASVKEGAHAHAYAQGQKPHECYLGYRSIPKRHTRGTVTFRYGEDYNAAGVYSLRYFGGDSAGRVCEVLPSSSTTDPYEHKNLQCQLSPISRGEIHVTSDRGSFSGATEKRQLPGYERTVNA